MGKVILISLHLQWIVFMNIGQFHHQIQVSKNYWLYTILIEIKFAYFLILHKNLSKCLYVSIVILIFGHAVLSQNQMTYQRMAECWSGFKGARLSLEVESP